MDKLPHPVLEEMRQKQLRKQMLMPNVKHHMIMKDIEGKDPKFASHMFKRNDLIEKFAKHLGGGINILDQPMCDHCEKPAAWNEGGTAHCFSCNRDTAKPITVHEYLMNYTKGYSEHQLRQIEEQLKVLEAMGGEIDDTVKQLIL